MRPATRQTPAARPRSRLDRAAISAALRAVTLATAPILAALPLAIVLLVALLFAACTAPTTESGRRNIHALGLRAVIDRVVDGDTIVVDIDGRTETVRLLGIDTPEKAGGPRPAECFGSEASAFAAELMPAGSAVWLSRDRETRDQYGRLLAYVHRADDELFVNQVLVEKGFATPLFFRPNLAFERQFEQAGAAARRNWQGFWPACGAADLVLDPLQ